MRYVDVPKTRIVRTLAAPRHTTTRGEAGAEACTGCGGDRATALLRDKRVIAVLLSLLIIAIGVVVVLAVTRRRETKKVAVDGGTPAEVLVSATDATCARPRLTAEACREPEPTRSHGSG